MSNRVMRCKLQVHQAWVPDWAIESAERIKKYMAENPDYVPHPNDLAPALQVNMGAVWEGSAEAQAASENAIFGAATPSASFSALIRNPAVIEKLIAAIGKEMYVDFIEVPEDKS